MFVDIAIYCPGDKGDGEIYYNIKQVDRGRQSRDRTIGFIKVNGTDIIPSIPAEILTPFHPIRPDYLPNLLGDTDTSANGGYHQFTGEGDKGGHNTTIRVLPKSLYDVSFGDPGNYLFNITVGEKLGKKISQLNKLG